MLFTPTPFHFFSFLLDPPHFGRGPSFAMRTVFPHSQSNSGSSTPSMAADADTDIANDDDERHANDRMLKAAETGDVEMLRAATFRQPWLDLWTVGVCCCCLLPAAGPNATQVEEAKTEVLFQREGPARCPRCGLSRDGSGSLLAAAAGNGHTSVVLQLLGDTRWGCEAATEEGPGSLGQLCVCARMFTCTCGFCTCSAASGEESESNRSRATHESISCWNTPTDSSSPLEKRRRIERAGKTCNDPKCAHVMSGGECFYGEGDASLPRVCTCTCKQQCGGCGEDERVCTTALCRQCLVVAAALRAAAREGCVATVAALLPPVVTRDCTAVNNKSSASEDEDGSRQGRGFKGLLAFRRRCHTLALLSAPEWGPGGRGGALEAAAATGHLATVTTLLRSLFLCVCEFPCDCSVRCCCGACCCGSYDNISRPEGCFSHERLRLHTARLVGRALVPAAAKGRTAVLQLLLGTAFSLGTAHHHHTSGHSPRGMSVKRDEWLPNRSSGVLSHGSAHLTCANQSFRSIVGSALDESLGAACAGGHVGAASLLCSHGAQLSSSAVAVPLSTEASTCSSISGSVAEVLERAGLL